MEVQKTQKHCPFHVRKAPFCGPGGAVIYTANEVVQFPTTMEFEDASKLMETIMIVCALLLSFSISSLQSVTHDDILSADKRWISALQIASTRAPDYVFIPSTYLLARIYQCIGIFTVVLITSITMYGSLMLSNVRDDVIAFEEWVRFFGCFIMMQYATLLAGVVILLQVNLSIVDIKFPLYHIDGPCFGSNASCYTSNTTFQWDDVINCPETYGPSNCVGYFDFVHTKANQYYMKNIIILFSVGAGFAIVLHFMLRMRLLRRARKSVSIYLMQIGISEQNKDSEKWGISDELRNLRTKYRRQFEAESIEADQYHLLSVDQLQGILKLPLGDALRIHEMEQECYSTWIKEMLSSRDSGPVATNQNAIQIEQLTTLDRVQK